MRSVETKANMKKTKFGLVEEFGIDNGELDGINPRTAFALGVEWEMFRKKLASQKPFTTLCLSENACRFVKMAEKNGRFVEERQTYFGWTEIWVGDIMRRKEAAK